MRSPLPFLGLLVGAGFLIAGCAGPEGIAGAVDNLSGHSDPSFSADLMLVPQTLDATAPTPISAIAHELFVSPTGDDEASGTEAEPLASFTGAQARVRALRDGDGHIAVWFAEGEYVFEQTAVLGPDDGGTPEQVITYAALPDAEVVFSALAPLSGWTAQSGSIQAAPLPAGVSAPRFLWNAEARWMPRSATELFLTPEASRVDEGCLECNWDTPESQLMRLNTQYPQGFEAPDWSLAAQYDLRQSAISWLQEILPIERVDESDRRIFTTIPAGLEMRLNFEEAENLNRNWVLNSLAGIDEPGEWAALDGVVYVYSDGILGDLRVPTLTELIRVDDGTEDGNIDSGVPVSHLRFEGLTFTGGDFYVMQSDDITVQHDWSVVDAPTALLRLRNTEDIVVSDCSFERSGSTGLRMDRHAQRNVVYGNTFADLGREAIVISGRGPGYGDVSRNNEVAYNHITRTGLEKWAAPAVVIDQSGGNRVHHNLIIDTQFTAIALTAPRQIAFVSLYEGVPGYLGREFHYYEVAEELLQRISSEPDELLGSYAAMDSIYNAGNLVELNTLVDVCQGAGYLVNGYVYNSASPRGGANTISFNYVHDTRNNAVNNPVFYSDADQDHANYVGNMVSGIENADAQPEAMPLMLLFAMYAEGEFNEGTRIASLGNAFAASTFPTLVEGINYGMSGTLVDDDGGDSSLVELYEVMLGLLESGELPRSERLPGEASMTQVLLDALVRVEE
jgi:hypothetical protein